MFEFIKPPTDNLYKFAAILGLILFVIGFFLPSWVFYQSGLELLKSEAGKDELQAHVNLAEERKQQLEKRKDNAGSELKELQARLKNLSSSGSGSPEIERLQSEIKEANKRFETLEDASYEFSLNLELKKAQTQALHTFSTNETRKGRLVLIVGVVTGAFGIWIGFWGFRRWHNKVQVLQDNILTIQAATAKAVTSPEKLKAVAASPEAVNNPTATPAPSQTATPPADSETKPVG